MVERSEERERVSDERVSISVGKIRKQKQKDTKLESLRERRC